MLILVGFQLLLSGTQVRKYISEGIKEGHYTANVGKVFEFKEMVQVHHYLEKGDVTGSVVVRV